MLEEEWLRSSFCYQLNEFLQFKATNNSSLLLGPAKSPFHEKALKLFDDSSRLHDDGSRIYQFLVIGRLATEKCLGYLIQAVLMIHNTHRKDHNKEEEHPAGGSSSSKSFFPSEQHRNGTETLAQYYDENFIQFFQQKIRFIIIGDGELKLHFQLWLGVFELHHYFTFIGSLTPSQLIDYYYQHYHEIIGVINPIGRGETFGSVHLEAQSMGKPVLAFHHGAAKESIYYGYVIPLIYKEEELNQLFYRLASSILLMVEDLQLSNMPFSSTSSSSSSTTTLPPSSLLIEQWQQQKLRICQPFLSKAFVFQLEQSVTDFINFLLLFVSQ